MTGNAYTVQVNVCCHWVELRYWGFEEELTDEMEESLREQGEDHAKESIIEGYHGGELNSLWDDNEIGGWWNII